MNTRFALAAILLAALLALASRGQSHITFEAPYTPGPIAGQQGWRAGDFNPAGALISDANPRSGLQHLRLGGVHAQQNLVSPLLMLPVTTDTRTSFEVSFHEPDPLLSSDVMIYANGAGGAAWLVWFEPGGVLLLSDSMSEGGGINNILADVAWSPDRYHTVTVDMQPAANLINYSFDGRLIHTGQLLQAASPMTLEFIRFGSPPDWPDDDFMDLDDLTVVPEPGVLGLAAAGLLYLAWRRR